MNARRYVVRIHLRSPELDEIGKEVKVQMRAEDIGHAVVEAGWWILRTYRNSSVFPGLYSVTIERK